MKPHTVNKRIWSRLSTSWVETHTAAAAAALNGAR